MKNKQLFLFLLLWAPLLFQAQKNAKTVVDATTRKGLASVFISSDNGLAQLMSNDDGRFIVVADSSFRSFSFYKLGFRRRSINVAELMKMDTIALTPRPTELEEVVVRQRRIDTIVKDKRFYVDDFQLLPDNNFLILTSRPNAEGFELCYYDRVKGIVRKQVFREESGARLFRDCFRNVHLLTDQFSRQVFFDSEKSFTLLSKYPRRTFDSLLAPCALEMDTQILVRQEMPPVKIELTYFDAESHSDFLNYVRVSRHANRLFYSGGYNAELREMIDHELKDAQLMYSHDPRRVYEMEAQIGLFYRSIAKALYLPVFLRQDTVVLFDFQEYRLLFFDPAGQLLKKTALNKKDFGTMHDFEVLYDEETLKFYIRMKIADHSVLREVNIHTGRCAATIRLEKIFASHVLVRNGRIYYLVRENEWDDTTYLYQQN